MEQLDLASLLPEELFDELSDKPEVELTSLSLGSYVSGCPSLLGNYQMTLHQDEAKNYYVCQITQYPIGDYGWGSMETWYSCNDNPAVEKILLSEKFIGYDLDTTTL